jgi:hypothetical protein
MLERDHARNASFTLRPPRGVRPKRGPTPRDSRGPSYPLEAEPAACSGGVEVGLLHHSAPSLVPTARSTARLAASSVRHAPRRRSAPVVVVGVHDLARRGGAARSRATQQHLLGYAGREDYAAWPPRRSGTRRGRSAPVPPRGGRTTQRCEGASPRTMGSRRRGRDLERPAGPLAGRAQRVPFIVTELGADSSRCYAWQSYEADHRLCPGQHPEAGHLWAWPRGPARWTRSCSTSMRP